MKKNNKFTYVHGQQITDQESGTRVYNFPKEKNGLPSVTTILSQTKDRTHLERWIKSKGHEEAERIKNYAGKRGTAMHKFIEKYIQRSGYEDLTPIGVEAKPMAQKIIETGLQNISEYYGSEVTLYYPGLYAGSTDLVCEHEGKDTIIDFKQTNRPKKKEWIEDYYLQIAAYAMAHDQTHGSNIEQGIIMMCTPELYFQEFKFEGEEMRRYRHQFLARLSQYHGKNVA